MTQDPSSERAQLSDTFNGNNAQLISCIKALLEMDADGILRPHGVGGHARGLLSAAAVRLAADRATAPVSVAEPVALPKDVLDALRFYAHGHHYAIDESQHQFDTVSGEPTNWMFSEQEEDCTMFEDGGIARAALLGHSAGFEEPVEPIEGEVFVAAHPADSLCAQIGWTDVDVAAALEQQRALRIVASVRERGFSKSDTAIPTQAESVFDLACEEIEHRLRTEVWELNGIAAPTPSAGSVPTNLVQKIQYIQSLILKWLNVKAGDPANAVWREIEDELKAIAAPPANTSAGAPTAEQIARVMWEIRREDEDRCDMELEDIGDDHAVWKEAQAVIDLLQANGAKHD